MKYHKCTFKISTENGPLSNVHLIMYNGLSDLRMSKWPSEKVKPGRQVRACMARLGLGRELTPRLHLLGVKEIDEDDMDTNRWNPIGKWKRLKKGGS